MAEPNTPNTSSTTGGNTPAAGANPASTPRSGASSSRDSSQSRSGIVDKVKESATAQLTSQKDRGTDALGSMAQAVRSSTQRLRDENHDVIAGYVDRAADQIEQWAQQLRQKDVDELVGDVQRLARRQPAVFVGSAFAVGLISARFLKSSRNDRRSYDDERYGYRGDMYGGRAIDPGDLDAVVIDEVVISDATPQESTSPRTAGGAGRTRRSSSRQEKS